MRQGVNVKHFAPCIDKPLIFLQEQTLGCSCPWSELCWGLTLTRNHTCSVYLVHVNNLFDFGGLPVYREHTLMGCGRVGALACEPVRVGAACHKCSNSSF